MKGLPENLYTAEQVRELDRRAIGDHGIDGYDLMCRAGSAAFDVIRERWPEVRRLAILAGRGNNGGDGYVIGRLALEAGWRVDVLCLGDHAGLAGAAARAASDYRQAGGAASAFAAGQLPPADLYVDAMLGTGLDRPLEGAYREAVDALNETTAPVFAVDVPTGLHADTGRVLGAAPACGATATFIGLKLGLLTGDAPDVTGDLYCRDLDVPAAVYDGLEPAATRIRAARVAGLLAPRRQGDHKGRFGHVLAIGGDVGMGGAVRLAGEAALRSGAGLVSIATRSEHAAGLLAGRPELMVRGVTAPDDLEPLLERATVIALGPGLGTGDWGRALWRRALEAPVSLVLDADALNLLAREPRRRGNWLLTPHPGEAARLLETDTASVQGDRPAAALELASRFDAVVVLKGAGSLVAAPGGELVVCDRGNPGMASGGMGDVLTGLAAGLLAQGLSPFDAALAAVDRHARAGDLAAQRGERGLAASDLFEPLRRLLNPPVPDDR